ncbi:MAG: hypothetical protein ACYTF8_16520, partial [Planctomycetota bacterium]
MSGIRAVAREGHGCLREPKRDCQIQEADPYVHRELIVKNGLRQGQYIEAHVGKATRGPAAIVAVIDKVEGLDPEQAKDIPDLHYLTVIDPGEAF